MLDPQQSPLNACLDFMRAVKAFEDQMTLVGPTPLKLTLVQMCMLKTIGESNHPLNARELKNKIPILTNNSSYNLDKLLKDKLITKTSCDDDKRAVSLSLTNKGRDILTEIDTYLEKVAKRTVATLPSIGLGTKS